MIVPFCDPTPQLFSAIEFNGKTLTLFGHPNALPYEGLVFKNYLRDAFATTANPCRVDIPHDPHQHSNSAHAYSNHLQDLAHIHLVFIKDIDLPLIKSIVQKIRFYQHKNNLAIRKQWQTSAAEDLKEITQMVNNESYAHKIFAWMAGLLTVKFNEADVISETNLGQMLQEFNKQHDNKKNILNTKAIMNVFANEIQYVPTPQPSMGKLQAATCSNVNNLVTALQAEHNFYDKSSTVAAYSLGALAIIGTGIALFSLQRCFCPVQNKKKYPAKTLKRR